MMLQALLMHKVVLLQFRKSVIDICYSIYFQGFGMIQISSASNANLSRLRNVLINISFPLKYLTKIF